MAIPRCEVVPVPSHQASFQIDGQERLRWHFGSSYSRPFFYPLLGPSGSSLTRMGHPGAPNHDHHQSVWFAHNKVLGIDFWGNQGTAVIRQEEWLAYQDADSEGVMAARLGWYDGHDPRPLLHQEVIAAVRPAQSGETLLEIQTTFRPLAKTLEFGQTNFGFLAVRVARNLSVHFGGGTLTSSEGGRGEAAIFGKPAKWMDSSGAVRTAPGETGETAIEGITYFDHPSNPGYPSSWHVRDDGWMCASPCMKNPLTTSTDKPLVLRYLLHVHSGAIDADRAAAVAQVFDASPGFAVRKSSRPHTQYEVVRSS